MLTKVRKRTKRLTCLQEARNVEQILGDLPDDETSVRIVTFTEFSAVGILRWFVERTEVNWLGVVTFRVGKLDISWLKDAAAAGKIREADFILGWINAERHGPNRELAESLGQLCRKYGWSLRFARNHVKVFLFDTGEGKCVCETSSNLNDLPNWEFFCVEKDEALFEFYRQAFFVAEQPEQEGGSLCQPEGSPSSSLKPRAGSISPKRRSKSVKPRK